MDLLLRRGGVHLQAHIRRLPRIGHDGGPRRMDPWMRAGRGEESRGERPRMRCVCEAKAGAGDDGALARAKARRRERLTTGTGARAGIGWYAADRCGMVDRHGLDAYCRPAVYTTVAAPSHDRNLRSLSKSLNASLLFGHVRAAGPGASVHQYNCHPFVRGRYMFMHNGDVSDFKSIRRGLLAHLRDDLFDQISGTTDSELVFSLILNELPNVYDKVEPKALEKAVFKAICIIIKANKGKANSVNIAITDGETIIATRYRNSATEEPPSLYFHLGPMPGEKAWDLDNTDGVAGFDQLVDRNIHSTTGGPRQRRNPAFQAIFRKKIFATQSLLVSSEPLSVAGLGNWQLCPPNCMIVSYPTRPTKGRCSRADLLRSLSENKGSQTTRPEARPSDAPVLEIEFKCLEDLCDTILKFKEGNKVPSEMNLAAMGGGSVNLLGRSESLTDFGSHDGKGIITPPNEHEPFIPLPEKKSVTNARGGMLGFSSLSRELRATSSLVGAPRQSIDVHQSPEDSTDSLRRLMMMRNSDPMAPSSWHEGSKYLNEARSR
ncbi:nucleophile aminohydrolase [Ostreococcus tauri]|uniref:Nucleophile aminohydrolase n=1 Tax=Ostreococcus tauri TaxID=70448 RepID=A0A1Y5IBE2_OSTTA|nr:nucleophile aminohydrolase [Ostreococcus tauri]